MKTLAPKIFLLANWHLDWSMLSKRTQLGRYSYWMTKPSGMGLQSRKKARHTLEQIPSVGGGKARGPRMAPVRLIRCYILSKNLRSPTRRQCVFVVTHGTKVAMSYLVTFNYSGVVGRLPEDPQ